MRTISHSYFKVAPVVFNYPPEQSMQSLKDLKANILASEVIHCIHVCDRSLLIYCLMFVQYRLLELIQCPLCLDYISVPTM